MYHISERDEGFETEHEEGGSRSYPARTAFGEAWTIGEKHPNLVASRSFLFGLVVVPMYEYRCVLSCAQIELLTVDKPVVNYGSGKKYKGGKPKRPTRKDVEEAKRKWEEKYKDGKKPVLDLSGFKIKTKQ